MRHLTLMHFNVRSLINKFDEVSTEIAIHQPNFVGITETWLSAKHLNGSYQLSCYNSYTNCRKSKTGDGTMLLVDSQIPSIQLTPDVTDNDAYNLCAAAIGNWRNTMSIVSAYRAPWASREDTIQICEQIDTLAMRFERIIVTGDFNLPKIQ